MSALLFLSEIFRFFVQLFLKFLFFFQDRITFLKHDHHGTWRSALIWHFEKGRRAGSPSRPRGKQGQHGSSLARHREMIP